MRVAVGWHFLYEGLAKYNEVDGKPFSAEGYFRNSAGPLAKYFRAIIPDVNGVERLTLDAQGLPAGLKSRWDEDLATYAAHYQFNDEQKQQAEAQLAAKATQADAWFRDRENSDKVRQYFAELRRAILLERDARSQSYQRELAWKERQRLNGTRNELLKPIEEWTTALHEGWSGLATEEQTARGAFTPPWTMLEWINTLTMYGLIAAGACLIVGLLTPLAALWCAGFLALIYLSFPPWPGVPEPPGATGHFWIVNLTLIELLACLVLASTPNGLWIGLDALLFGWIGRKSRDDDEAPTEREGLDRTLGAAELRRPGTVTRSERR